MSKLFSPDEETFIYANTQEEAANVYEEEFDGEYAVSDFIEYPLDTVVDAVELVGIGGYDELYASSVIREYEKMGIKAPYVLDIELYKL